jgi:hypothetical protein
MKNELLFLGLCINVFRSYTQPATAIKKAINKKEWLKAKKICRTNAYDIKPHIKEVYVDKVKINDKIIRTQ